MDDLDSIDERELDELEDTDPGPERRGAGLRGFLAGVVVGAVLGAGAAVLSAPSRGKVLRRQLKRRVEQIGDDARERAEGWRDEASRRLSRRRRRLRGRRRNRDRT